MMTRLVGFFGLLAQLLACVGIYGVMAYTIARRTHEIGIRMALGARQTDVAAMVMRETAGLVIGGIVLGIPAALGTTRLIQSLLFGVDPTDPVTIAIVTLAVLIVAGMAGLLPARRGGEDGSDDRAQARVTPTVIAELAERDGEDHFSACSAVSVVRSGVAMTKLRVLASRQGPTARGQRSSGRFVRRWPARVRI